MCFTDVMSEDTLIRKANLRRLGLNAAQLAALEIGGYSYWAAILPESSTKSFAEKKVRELEGKLGLARGIMDIPDADLKAIPTAWLLPRVDIKRFNLLSMEGKAAVQAIFKKAIEDEIEVEQSLNQKANGSTG